MTSPSSVPRAGELQVNQDLQFQRRMWTAQRYGWALLGVLVAAALAGLFGQGPMAEATVAAGGLEVRYGRIERHRSAATLDIRVSTQHAEEGSVEVWIDRGYADALRIEGVKPEPDSVTTSDTRITYTFDVDEAEPRARISFDVTHQGIGARRGRMGVDGGPVVSFRQLILP